MTSGGSQNWADLYGKANDTAMAIKRLANLGGVIVGKTKTAMCVLCHSIHIHRADLPCRFAMGSSGVSLQSPMSSMSELMFALQHEDTVVIP